MTSTTNSNGSNVLRRFGESLEVRPVIKGVWAGPRPETPQDYGMLQRVGVEQILNLETGIFNTLHPRAMQESAVSAHFGFDEWRIRCGVLLPPTRNQIEWMFHFLGRSRTYLHCRQGVDRTGVMVAAIRARYTQLDRNSIWELLLQEGFHKIRYRYWVPYIRRTIIHYQRYR